MEKNPNKKTPTRARGGGEGAVRMILTLLAKLSWQNSDQDIKYLNVRFDFLLITKTLLQGNMSLGALRPEGVWKAA